jgi:hypothetical protein
MFGLFKKTSWKIEGKSLDFFKQVFIQLPKEFHFLKTGLDNGVYIRFSVNRSMKKDNYSISFDSLQSDKLMLKKKNFELNNINILEDKKIYPLNLTIYDGLWIGFEINKNIFDFNKFEVDLSSLTKSEINSPSNAKIDGLMSGLNSDKLDLTSYNVLDVGGEKYFIIKDIEDGNYIGIDINGNVFGLIHAPYKIELINKSLVQFVNDVNSGEFNFDNYINGQN